MQTGMHIGNNDKDSEKVADNIVRIIEASPDREVAVAALHAYTTSTQVSNVSVTNCVFGDNPVFEDDDDYED